MRYGNESSLQTYRRGQEYEIGDGVARSMMQMGIVERAQQTLFETAAIEPVAEKAVKPIARKRGRPRKVKP
jgi:hypothetical protein